MKLAVVPKVELTDIPLCDPWFRPSYADAVKNQILSGWLGPAKACQNLSTEIQKLSGASHVALTTSGTVALTVAAIALGLKPGDEILVPAYGVISTINGFASFGFKMGLVDIDKRTGCLSLEALKTKITKNTKAVCFVNFSGATGPELLEVAELCKKRGVFLIEDAACAFGQELNGKGAGSFGDVGTYSFSVPKLVTTGQGGAVLTSHKWVFDNACKFIDHGDLNWRKTNLNNEIGTNLRYNDILASLALAQVADLQVRKERKREAYTTLQKALGRKLFQAGPGGVPLHNIVLAKERDRLVDYLKGMGIQAAAQYRTVSEHPPFQHLKGAGYPNSDFWSKHAVYLPFGLGLTVEQAQRIADAVSSSGVELYEFK